MCAFYEREAHGPICNSGDDIAFYVSSMHSTLHRVPARRFICHEREQTDNVPILCKGWAAESIGTGDGRRQIISILLPGDIISPTLLVEPTAHCVVEAITDVQYRTYKRSMLRAALITNPDMIDSLLKGWVKRKLRVDQHILDLGRRSAEERIARLILTLMDRLSQLGLMQGDTMTFPLRHRHIADVTGLTTVHVSKVMTELKSAKLIAMADRTLTILDLPRLTRLTSFR